MATKIALFIKVSLVGLVVFASSTVFVGNSFANETNQGASDYQFEWKLLPFREVIVDGNVDRFKAHHWVNDGYGGGLDEFYLFQRAKNDVTIKMEGQAIPSNNEYEGMVEIKKKELGFLKFDYQEFRRYYDRQGGVNHRFRGYRGGNNSLAFDNVAPKELALDIGHFGVETGLRVDGLPEVTFGYEREYRDGAKSRLRWGTVTEASNLSGLSRKIAPAWSDIREIVDTFDLKVDHTIKGFELKSDHKYEQVRIDQTTTELQFSPDGDTNRTNHYILKQHIKPESRDFSTAWQVAKWLLKDKIYSSTGYRFATVKAQEWEDTQEYDENLNPYSTGSNSETRRDSRADGYFETNSWVQNLMYQPFKWLNLGSKLKGELANRHGESNYNRVLETAAGNTDGLIDNTLVSETEATVTKWGESFSARFTAIPRTALYSELELEQSRTPTSESRVQVNKQTVVSDTETYERETITQVGKGMWTVGARMTPVSIVDLTTHFRHLRKDTTYNDVRETSFGPASSTNAYSAFFAGQKTKANEFLTRLGLKLTKFFQPSARFVHRETRYYTSVENTPLTDQADVPTGVDTNNYIFDVTSQLFSNLMALTSFSHLSSTTWTPAKDAYLGPTQIGNIPAFDSAVNTWSFSLAYSPKSNISFINALSYSRANNFDDYSDHGLPLGADYRMLEVDSGLKFNLLKDRVTFEPKYSLYHYNANANVDSGDYTAHVLSCEISMAWG